ncbi:MAG: hypothetical protein GX621_11940, partial [Pirellulaceae bacterium]|nr:hypothetical protein [Pirellulaceae bacterium]
MGRHPPILDSASDVSLWDMHFVEPALAMGSDLPCPSRGFSDRAKLDALDAERESLRESNAALVAAVERLTAERKAAEEALITNVQKVLMPVLQMLHDEVRPDQRKYVSLLKTNLL